MTGTLDDNMLQRSHAGQSRVTRQVLLTIFDVPTAGALLVRLTTLLRVVVRNLDVMMPTNSAAHVAGLMRHRTSRIRKRTSDLV